MNNLEKQADRLFSPFIKNRDGGCVIGRMGATDCWGPLECAHLLRRGFKAVRWDPRNAVTLCAGHHTFMTEHPLVWADWREQYAGPVTMRDLLRRAYGGEKPDVAAIVESLKEAS